MAKICNSDTYTVKETFEDMHYAIPDYQRKYTWKHDVEVEDLCNDLIENYNKNPDKPYLLGPIVTLQNPLHEPHDIVDGQQRLITMTLLFCALRKALENYIPIEEDDKKDYDDLVCEINKSIIGSDNTPRITLNDTKDKELFEKICTEKEISINVRSKSNIIKNYRELLQYLEKLFEKYFENKTVRDKIRIATKMFYSIRDNTCFVYIEITNDEYVYPVFQSLNSKGQKLQQADLIKSHLLSICSDTVTEKWSKIMEFESIQKNPDDFLYYSTLSRNCTEDIMKINLYNHIRKKVKTQERVDEYLDKLIEDSEIIRMLYDPKILYSRQNTKHHDYVHLFYGIKQINAKYFQRPIIAACRKWGLDDDRTRQLVDCLLKFFFMYRTICKSDIERIKTISKKITCDIHDGKEMSEIFYKILKNETVNDSKYNVEQDDFNANFKENTNNLTDNVIKYILYSLEHKLRDKQDIQIMQQKFELEHIFPKNSNIDDWPNKTELENHIKRLGNITLLDHEWNSSRSNHGFSHKMDAGEKCYKKSGLELNKQYLDYKQWGMQEIENRETKLLELAKDVWDLSEYTKQAKKPED